MVLTLDLRLTLESRKSDLQCLKWEVRVDGEKAVSDRWERRVVYPCGRGIKIKG